MRSKSKFTQRNILLAGAFLLGVPAVAHLLFSWMGFNPTDQGFTLAYSRRILEGQVPHRDFIIIRPFVSPLIHTPLVAFGGEYTYWLSRFSVWFQFACISWAWVSVANRAFNYPFGDVTRFFVALVGFVASANLFPTTAWHTIDGMFFASLGVLVLATRERPSERFAGYFLIAVSYLCKQSFIFMAPLSLLILGGWREKKNWAAIAAPGMIYIVYLLATGALPDAVSQITSQKGLFSIGIISYLNYGVFLGVVAGFGSVLLLYAQFGSRPRLERAARNAGAAALISLPAGFVAVGLYLERMSTVSYGIFGVLLGLVFYRLFDHKALNAAQMRAALLVLLLAWSASLSLGANSPLLMLGPLLTALITVAYRMRRSSEPWFLRTVLVVMGVLVLASFGVARPNYIYYERSYSALTKPLGGVLPGGRLIYTNPTTYAFMADLDKAVSMVLARNKKYAIIPDIPGYWVQADQTNPLPIDWLFPVELGDQELIDRVERDLDAGRPDTIVIVQKVDAFFLAEELRPLDENDYPMVEYVRENFDKVGETRFFELYE